MTDCDQWEYWELHDGSTIEKLRKCIDDDVSELFAMCLSYTQDYNLFRVGQFHTGYFSRNLLYFKDYRDKYYMYGVPCSLDALREYNRINDLIFNRSRNSDEDLLQLKQTALVDALELSEETNIDVIRDRCFEALRTNMKGVDGQPGLETIRRRLVPRIEKLLHCLAEIDPYAAETLTQLNRPVVRTRVESQYLQQGNTRIYVYYVFYNWLCDILKRTTPGSYGSDANKQGHEYIPEFMSIAYSEQFDASPARTWCKGQNLKYLLYRFFNWQRLSTQYPFEGGDPDPFIFSSTTDGDQSDTPEKAAQRKASLIEKIEKRNLRQQGESDAAFEFRTALIEEVRKMIEPLGLIFGADAERKFQQAFSRWNTYDKNYILLDRRTTDFGRRRRTRPAVTRMLY